MPKALTVQNVNFVVNDQKILSDINLELESGQMLFLLGSNGSGKSTLARLILGLDKQTTGTIKIYERVNTFETVSQYCGYLPQYSKIERSFPMSVAELIQLECESTAKCNISIQDHLKLLNLQHLQNRRLDELSGGEFQRVLIARSIVSEPKLLVLDEPTNNLDHKSEQELWELIRDLQQKQHIAILLITHDQDIKFQDGDQVIKLVQGQITAINNH